MDWEEVKKNVQRGAEIAAEKVSQYSRIGKLKMDQLILKRRIEKNYISAGLRAYEYVKDSKEDAIPVVLIDEFIQEIDTAQTEIDSLEREIEKIREEAKKDKDEATGDEK